MTIYKKLLGKDFERLHPKLQERYALSLDIPFVGIGVMRQIKTGSKILSPFLHLATRFHFLFPESGMNVPFTIQNTSRLLPTGEVEVYWERTFYFKSGQRQFNAFMTIDTEKRIVKDYLGNPNLFYSDLDFTVTKEGRLMIRSGAQRLLLSKVSIPLSPTLQGRVTVEEGYDDSKDMFTIHVYIHNPIVGRLMAYAGEFKAQPHK